MKKINFVLVLAWISFILVSASYFFLPEQIPMHWNMNGEVDSYGPKYYVFVMAVLPVAIYYLINITRKMDPKHKQIEEKLGAYNFMRDITVMIFVAISAIFIFSVLNPNFNITSILMTVLGLSFVVLGNYMPRVPHNYHMGVKTPWAFADEDNWKKTQRVGGYVLCFSGFCMACSAFLEAKVVMPIVLGIILIGVIGTYVYSWLLFKKGEKEHD